MKRGVDVGGRDLFHALQRFQTTLRLPCLGSLGAEAIDIEAYVGDFPLLRVQKRHAAGANVANRTYRDMNVNRSGGP